MLLQDTFRGFVPALTPFGLIPDRLRVFGPSEHLAWHYEQGYSVITKVQSSDIPRWLAAEADLRWEKISKNGCIAAKTRIEYGNFPNPLRVFAGKRWWGDDRPAHWPAPAVTPDLTAAKWPAREVGVLYNGRQIIEAGIKESKGIFASRQLPTRHQPDIALYQELVLVAQNFLGWFRRQVLSQTPLAAVGIKELVQFGARSHEIIALAERGLTVAFDGDSPWRHCTVVLQTFLSDQLPLPDFDALVEVQP